ncbi:MAG: AtuA-related protein [Janthinobacterium lividum]
MRVQLYDLAHSRAGDKGNVSTLSLIPYQAKDYPLLCAQVTAAAVQQHLQAIVAGDITRYEMPYLPALHFVCQQALLGGVTTAMTMDTHGKSLSSALLEMWVELPDERQLLK